MISPLSESSSTTSNLPPLMSVSNPPQPLTFSSTDLYQTALSFISVSKPQNTQQSDTLPHSKLIPNTRFVIDGFNHANTNFSVSYFLSHFHSDHYTGLTPQWSKGIIYCSHITAKLLNEILKIPKPFICQLPLSQKVIIDGSEVYLIDANHCPGAVQFLFKVPVGNNSTFEKYVHTGDFRYCNEMKGLGVLSDFVGADAVFLDTTYCNPKYVFPSQDESIDYIVGVIERIGNVANLKNVLFLVATYVVGKERILTEISRRCNKKIHVSGKKMAVLCALGLDKNGVFTENESESDVHVVGWNVLGETWPYFRPNFVNMKAIMSERGYSKVVGFVPTGWTYEMKSEKFAVRKKENFEIHLVPYSEHSNYDELREYVKFLKPKRVIPTVGADVEKVDSKHALAMQKHFAGLVDEMAIKQKFLTGFTRCGTSDEHVDAEKDSENFPRQDFDLESDTKCSLPQQELDLNENDAEKSVKELQDCLPNWATRSQILDLLRNCGGNVVEAVSNFYEHETEFYERVLPTTSVSCTFEEGLENQSASPVEMNPIETKNRSEVVSFSQSFKLSSCGSLRKGKNISPGKRKRNHDGKGKKKARTDSTQDASKQYSIMKFFSKKGQDDQNRSPTDAIMLYKEEVDRFIQIVNGDEKLRRRAAIILGKSKGDINMALDIYYSENIGSTNEPKDKLLDRDRVICTSDEISQISESKNLETKSDFFSPPIPKDDVSGNYVSLPLESYSPIEHACWSNGQPAPYIHIARTFVLVEEEKGKIKATSMLCNMFRSLLALSPEDVLPAVYLCTNKIAPDHENLELNIGGSLVVSALEEACGTSKSKVNNLYNSLGDLGDVAQLCRQTQSLLAPPPALTIVGLYSILRKISAQTGGGSTNRKKSLIVNLMRSCREKEIKFLVRTLVRNLRIGAMMRTVLPALAQAIVMNSVDEAAENLKDHLQRLSGAAVEAYNILPSLDLLIPSLMEKGIEFSSSTLSMVPGIPIKPMLAKITNGTSQVLKNFQEKSFTCEYKYDGQRAQIHRLSNGSVRVFSRNGDETSGRFPDLIDIIKDLHVHAAEPTFIVDAEVVAIDRNNNLQLMSFQELSSRERGSKSSTIDVQKIKVDICIFVFDIMFANGKQLLNLPLRQRRKYLKDLFGEEKPGFFEYAREMMVESQDANVNNGTTMSKMNNFLDDALRSSCEGIMVKSLDVDAGYTPSKRSDAWLKVKKDYVEGLSDSVDLVPIGAWYGNGRKAGWFSPFLMACYKPDTEEFQSVCRVMSGFSDDFYKEMKDFFSGDKILTQKPPYYRTDEVADMWFSAELVWQIKGADFTISPVHHAAMGLVHTSRGISMRFPRFIRSVSDRKPEECSTAADIADMFNSQMRKMDVSLKNKHTS